jgi:hypothetical protein
MAFLDPLVNAQKVDLLGGKQGGLFSVWDNIRTPVRRKRLFPERSNEQENRKHDFLKSSAGVSETNSIFRPSSSIYETKFNRGFHRRPVPQRDSLRFEIDSRAWERFNHRKDQAAAGYDANRRDLINGFGLPPDRPYGRRRGPGMMSQFDSARTKESMKRNVDGQGRFFMERPKRESRSVPCETVLVGLSGEKRINRIQSVGVFDNFAHTQTSYRAEPSRPAHRRSLSQIALL